MSPDEVPPEPEKGPAGDPAERRKALVAGILVFALALGVRLAFVADILDSYLADERLLISDTRFYDLRGTEIAQGDLIGKDPGYLSPTYCAFLGGVYAFGGDLEVAKVVQAILGALTCVLVFLLGRTLFDWRAGALAGTVLALYGMHIYYSGLLLPTVLVVFFNVAFLVLAMTAARPPSLARLFFAGAVLGLAIGSKPNALLMIPAAMLWILAILPNLDLARRIRMSGALFFGVVLTVAPITIKNYIVSGEVVLVSVVGGRNLLKGNGPDADGSHTFLPPGKQGHSLKRVLDGGIDPSLAVADDGDKKRKTFAYMKQNPGRALGLFGKKLFLMLNSRELAIRDQYDFARTRFPLLGWMPFSFGLVVPLGLVGMLATLRRRTFTPMHFLIAVQMASFVIVFVLGRYRLVMVACLIVLGAGHVFRLIEAMRSRQWRFVGWSAFLWAAFTTLTFLPAPGFPKERGWADQYFYSARVHRKNERWSEALVDLAGALETRWINDYVRRTKTELYVEVARCQIHLGRGQEALTALDKGELSFHHLKRDHALKVRGQIDDLRHRAQEILVAPQSDS